MPDRKASETMDMRDVVLAAPAPSSVRVMMGADDPRRGRLVGMGWRQIHPAPAELMRRHPHRPETCTMPDRHAVCDVCGECCYTVGSVRALGLRSVWLHRLHEWEMPEGWEPHPAAVSRYVDGVKVLI